MFIRCSCFLMVLFYLNDSVTLPVVMALFYMLSWVLKKNREATENRFCYFPIVLSFPKIYFSLSANNLMKHFICILKISIFLIERRVEGIQTRGVVSSVNRRLFSWPSGRFKAPPSSSPSHPAISFLPTLRLYHSLKYLQPASVYD